MREQWLRRLLKNPSLNWAVIMTSFARGELAEAGNTDKTSC
ncbi:MAG: hypothetical protein PHG00_07745 [Methylococcales bacterium]|nr:hypothetical protein [Methylococcales bacterium]